MATVAALTGAIANMAAIETAYEANWASAPWNTGAKRSHVVVTTNLAAGQTMRLLIRANHPTGAAPVWYAHEDGAYTIPAKVTGDSSDWTGVGYSIGEEWTGLVVWASNACSVSISATDMP